MPIIFSAIAQDKNILAYHANCEGNFMEITQEILLKIPSNNHKMTYSHGCYLLHYILEYHKFFLCVTDKTCQRSKAFLYLNEIKRRHKTVPNRQLRTILSEEMARYSDDNSGITIRNGELDELNHIGVGSSEEILGEKLLVINNPDTLEFSRISFVGVDPQHLVASKGSTLFYLIILAVTMIAIWLFFCRFGPTSLVFIACIAVICLSISIEIINLSK